MSDPDVAVLSNRAIARKLGVSYQTVASVRESMGADISVRVGADGRVYRVRPRPRPGKPQIEPDAEGREDLERRISDMERALAAARMREVRNVFRRTAIRAIRAIGEMIPPEISVALKTQGFASVTLEGSTETLTLTVSDDELVHLVVRAVAITEDVDFEADEWETQRPIKDVSRLLEKHIGQWIKEGMP